MGLEKGLRCAIAFQTRDIGLTHPSVKSSLLPLCSSKLLLVPQIPNHFTLNSPDVKQEKRSHQFRVYWPRKGMN